MPSYRSRKAKKAAQHVEPVKYNTLDNEYLRRVFEEFDKDKNDYLDKGECAAALAKIGSNVNMKEIDQNQDGKVTWDEFVVFSHISGVHTHPIWKSARNNTTCDNFSNTGISLFAGDAHLNEAFSTAASKSWQKLATAAKACHFSEESIDKVWTEIDLDGNGELSMGELSLAIKRLAPQLTAVDMSIMRAVADKDGDQVITKAEFKEMMMADHEKNIEYWEAYKKRDMQTKVADRRGTIRYN